jgi:hypothetical protein
MAFLILKPCSYILTPRYLHSLNVFMIKLTNLPVLVVIGMYERHVTLARESGKESSASTSMFRHIKNIPFMEALVGSTSTDVYDAIFELDSESEDEGQSTSGDQHSYRPLRSIGSRETLRRKDPSPVGRRSVSRPPSNTANKRPRLLSTAVVEGLEIPSAKSPLARFFSGAKIPTVGESSAISSLDATVRKVEAMVDDMRDLPVQRLKDEMKELQVRTIVLL